MDYLGEGAIAAVVCGLEGDAVAQEAEREKAPVFTGHCAANQDFSQSAFTKLA
jgi:hypothetical protein